MTSFRFDIVGFDLDGTLLDTSGDLAAAVNHALASIGRTPLSVEQVKPMIGGGARHMLAQGLAATGGCDESELDRLHDVLLGFYEANICVHTAPYPGVIAALDALAVLGPKLAVVTNKKEAFALPLLRAVGLLDRFDCVIGGDALGPGKGKPAPDLIEAMVARCGGGRAVFVGDSIYDVTAAHAAGLPAVACSFGFVIGPVAELGADAVIDHFDELLPVLERL
jgi:phosphoglycolate phosphatase